MIIDLLYKIVNRVNNFLPSYWRVNKKRYGKYPDFDRTGSLVRVKVKANRTYRKFPF